MSVIDKHRIHRKYFDTFAGDDSADAALYASAAGEGLSSLLKPLLQKKAEDDAKAKKDADQKAYDASHADEKAAVLDAQQKQKAAAMKAADATAAAMKASTEQDPNGPLHKAAQKAQNEATLYAADAKAAADKVAFYKGGSGSSDTAMVPHKGGGSKLPSWVMPVGIGLGVGVLGLITYKMLKKK